MNDLMNVALLAALVLASCAANEPAPGAVSTSWFDSAGIFRGHSPRAPIASADPVAGSTESPITRFPEVPSVAPPIPGGPVGRAPYLYAPGTTAPSGGYGLPLNPGPVTGYGPGGLAQPPGAPPNPPFHYTP